MDEKQPAKTKSWWAKYRRWIIALLAIYALILLLLIVLAAGPQQEPFRYQIF
jgi:ABC-type antimicrobial peptide transport system permease subunit